MATVLKIPGPMKTLWQLEGVTLAGDVRPRLDAPVLQISPGVTAVIGHSGAGKTSLLNLLVGFERPDTGRVVPTHSGNTERLPLFWVPQNDGLWPHLTVRRHLEAVAPVNSTTETEGLLARFDLRELADAHPDWLSRGERGRLSVARAMASGAAVLVMDEPLVHVDPGRAGDYWGVLRSHCAGTDTSLVFASHSPETVLREAQHVVCLHSGTVAYAGDVQSLYYRPVSREMAAFLGPANWLPAGEAREWLLPPVPPEPCIRPEQMTIAPADNGPVVVEASRFAGSLAEVELRHDASGRRRTFYHRPAADTLRNGMRVALRVGLALLFAVMVAGCDADADGPRIPVQAVRHWAMPPAERSIPAPRSLTVGSDGEIFVLDNAGRVLVLDRQGELQRQWWMPEYDVGKPEGICILEDGRIAVADTHYHRVVYFDESGNVVGMQGSHGTGPGEFIYPVAVVQDDSGFLYVAEYGGNDRVQKFTADGEFVLTFGTFGTGAGQLQRPGGIAWHDGQVFIADAINNRIQVYRDDGEFLHVFGAAEAPSELHYPYDISLSADGDFFVVEYGAGRVSRFSQEGRLLGRFGTTGSGEGQFSTPWGLTVDGNSRVIVADTGNRRIVELEL